MGGWVGVWEIWVCGCVGARVGGVECVKRGPLTTADCCLLMAAFAPVTFSCACAHSACSVRHQGMKKTRFHFGRMLTLAF